MYDFKFYVPEDQVQEQQKRLRNPLQKWMNEGYVIATPGDTIDLEYLERDTLQQHEEKRYIDFIGYDPHRAKLLVKNLSEKMKDSVGNPYENIASINQGFLSISEPTSLLLTMVKRQDITHMQNPVIDWMATNLSVEVNSWGNIKPMKAKNNIVFKIDGFAALINYLAIHVAKTLEDELDVSMMVG